MARGFQPQSGLIEDLAPAHFCIPQLLKEPQGRHILDAYFGLEAAYALQSTKHSSDWTQCTPV